MATTSPGWYPDGHGGMRWWDGANWDTHVAPAQYGPPASPEAAPPEAAPPAVDPTVAEPPVVEPAVEASFAAPFAAALAPAVTVAAPPAVDLDPPPTPTERRRSRVWIVWAVLGAVLLLVIVVGVAVILPMVRGLSNAGGSTEEAPVPAAEQSTAEDPIADPPSGADEEAALAAVERYNEAWLTADCELYLATTSEVMREFQELAECEEFAPAAADYAGSIDGFEMTVRDVETVGAMIAVSVTESYTSRWDAEGNETPDPVRYDDRLEYLVLNVDGGWVVDDVFPE